MKKIKPTTVLGMIFLLSVFSGCAKEDLNPSRCSLEPDPGPCYAYMPKYYYDKTEKRCKEFIYGGCGGTVPFETLEECRECECAGGGE